MIAHGGRHHSEQEPSDLGHTILRMWPFAAAAASAVPSAAVGFVRYRHRGWNDRGDPVDDLCRVLDAAAIRGFDRVALVGHSMGGRTVVACGSHRLVAGVAALSPWLPADEPLRQLGGRLVVMAHGDRDRITSAALTARFAARVRRSAVPMSLLRAEDETHALLRRAGDWDQLVSRFVTSALTNDIDAALAAASSADPDHGADPLPRWSARRAPLGALLGIAGVRHRLPVVRSLALD